ncbi:MAG TPA: CaiB/BaiF CoA-transferase family protein [Polyangiaceae bacterium]|nr:CaiB/BaiF CoA-transferase family protein [Polyangiaceae bacterium]
MAGPLNGIRVLEVAGIGPGPFCGMMLADMGAEVVRIDRPGDDPAMEGMHRVLLRNRKRVTLDLKKPEGVAAVLRMVGAADALFEGFRPGVAERLGIGPDACLANNPRLVYGRMTGWGQSGPLATTAGHDINYIALSGALHAIGRKGDRPVPPLNLVGDFGGGGMMLAFGMVCALLEARSSGLGQVIDASMVEGSAALMAMFFGARASGLHGEARGTNLLDTGAPFYDVYETKDSRYVAVGPLEPQFFAVLRSKLALDASFGAQFDVASWPSQKEALATLFRSRTRDEWEALFAGSDACVSPVLSMDEAPRHAHNASRQSFVTVGGAPQPAPTPRFSRTAPAAPEAKKANGADTRRVLLDFGFGEAEIETLIAKGAVSTS